jgi:anti-sigma factor RsiW
MDCRKIREIIMTDYIDGELEPRVKDKIDRHLKACPGCREFEARLRAEVVGPIRESQRYSPPESTWENIEKAIIQKELEGVSDYLNRISRGFASLRRPAVALAVSLGVLLVVIGVFKEPPVNNSQEISRFIQDQMAFYSYLDGQKSAIINGDYADFGTSIEEYFL